MKSKINPVAKNCYKFNRPVVVDSKKVYKRIEKHRGRDIDPSFI